MRWPRNGSTFWYTLIHCFALFFSPARWQVSFAGHTNRWTQGVQLNHRTGSIKHCMVYWLTLDSVFSIWCCCSSLTCWIVLPCRKKRLTSVVRTGRFPCASAQRLEKHVQEHRNTPEPKRTPFKKLTLTTKNTTEPLTINHWPSTSIRNSDQSMFLGNFPPTPPQT